MGPSVQESPTGAVRAFDALVTGFVHPADVFEFGQVLLAKMLVGQVVEFAVLRSAIIAANPSRTFKIRLKFFMYPPSTRRSRRT